MKENKDNLLEGFYLFIYLYFFFNSIFGHGIFRIK